MPIPLPARGSESSDENTDAIEQIKRLGRKKAPRADTSPRRGGIQGPSPVKRGSDNKTPRKMRRCMPAIPPFSADSLISISITAYQMTRQSEPTSKNASASVPESQVPGVRLSWDQLVKQINTVERVDGTLYLCVLHNVRKLCCCCHHLSSSVSCTQGGR
jgi:hypothetical protein